MPRSSAKSPKQEFAFGALIDTRTGRATLVEPTSSFFQDLSRVMGWDRVAAASVSQGTGTRRTTSSAWDSTSSRRYSEYQRLTGNLLPSLRERLLPAEGDYYRIADRIDFYVKRIHFLNRGLMLRASLNASEFRMDAPGSKEQSDWQIEKVRDLRMFSFMREFFRTLRTYGQVIPMWRTEPGGRSPDSIECADPRVYRTRFNPFDGTRPRIVVLPSKDAYFSKLVEDSQGPDDDAKRTAVRLLKAYPKPFQDVAQARDWRKTEIEAEDLEGFGIHFGYAAYDRRHWEDWAFPGMFSIFPHLEMLLLADDADINALHHYKAGILLVRLGSPEPRDASMFATEDELKVIDAKLVEMGKARLPAWAARGDLRVDWIVPPETIISDAKVKSAKAAVLNWLGIPKVFWPGEDFSGAYAAALVTLKALQQESKDERDIAKEWAEGWFHAHAKASNRFEGAVWPRAWFDPTALQDPRLVLELARMFLQLGGADEQTIAEMFDYDAETWLSRRKSLKELQKKLGVDFAPEFVPQKQSPLLPGRPPSSNQPTPESEGMRQTRPSVVEGVLEVAEREFGIDARLLREAVEHEGIVE